MAKGLDLGKKYRVNHTFTGPNGQLRSGSLIIEAPDEATAMKAADLQRDKLHGEGNWRHSNIKEW